MATESTLREQGQSDISVEKNIEFFKGRHGNYKAVYQFDDGEADAKFITTNLCGIEKLCDIGNGGVFRYNHLIVPQISAVDLVFDETTPSFDNVTFKKGSALSIPFLDHSFDGVVLSSILHHLTGSTVADTYSNLKQAIAEAFRVLSPEGKCIILEPCLRPILTAIETACFPITAWAIKRYCTHPPAYQFSKSTIYNAILSVFGNCQSTRLPKRKHETFLDFRIPGWVVPNHLVGFLATRID